MGNHYRYQFWHFETVKDYCMFFIDNYRYTIIFINSSVLKTIYCDKKDKTFKKKVCAYKWFKVHNDLVTTPYLSWFSIAFGPVSCWTSQGLSPSPPNPLKPSFYKFILRRTFSVHYLVLSISSPHTGHLFRETYR